MASLANTFEGAVPGTSVSPTNTAGGGDAAGGWTGSPGPVFATPPGGYSDSGSLSARILQASSTTTAFNTYWTFSSGTQVRQAVRFYFYAVAHSTNQEIFSFATGATRRIRVDLTASEAIRVLNASGTAVYTSGTLLSLNTWYRIEIGFTRGTTTSNGKAQLRVYNLAGTLLITTDITGQNFNTTDPDRFYIGPVSNTNSGTRDFYYDNLAYTDTLTADNQFIGAYVPPPPTFASKIYLGTNLIAESKLKLGTSDVSKVYLGTNQIYGNV